MKIPNFVAAGGAGVGRAQEPYRTLAGARAPHGEIRPAQTCRCRDVNGTCVSDAIFDFCPQGQSAHCARTYNPRTGRYQCQCACY